MADPRGGPPDAPEAWWARPPSTAAVGRAAPPRPASRPASRPTARQATRPAARQVAPSRDYSYQRRSGGAPFGDQRGLTTAGATALVLLLGGLAAGVDVATGTGLRTVFAVAFTIAAALAAATVHHEDLLASVVLVPLCFAVIGGVSGFAEGSSLHTLSKLVLGVANVMVTAAPALISATITAAVIAGMRGYGARRRSRTPWRRSVAGAR